MSDQKTEGTSQPNPTGPAIVPPPLSDCNLRDFAAAHALAGVIASGREATTSNPMGTAKLCWAYADALLATRGVSPGPSPVPPA